MDDLVARFHSLQGSNLQEVKRSFNEFLHAIQPHQADLNTLTDSIHPKTKLEAALKVDLLVHFKQYDALLLVLKSGNPMLISKVLKCWSFFDDVFGKIDARTLVEQIFPRTSYSTRMKLITKLSKNLKDSELADAYFQAVEDKYGLSVAKGLLPACSLDLIKSTVAKHKVIFSGRQLQTIVKRDLKFLDCYFEASRQAHGEDFDFSERYKEVLRRTAKTDEEFFWALFKKYRFKVRLGHRMTTPSLYKRGKILVTVSDYERKCFSMKKIYAIVKSDEAELRKLLLDVYPKQLDSLASNYAGYCLRSLIGCLRKSKGYLVNSCFKEVYGKGIHEVVAGDIPPEFIQLIPAQEREGLVFVDDALVYMYPIKKSIALLRERIKYTSDVKKRRELAVLLAKSCKFNEDLGGTLEALKYLRARHKNDQNVLIDFLKELYESDHLDHFGWEHWGLIFELLKLVMPHYQMYCYGTYLMRRYLHYAVENQLPCEDFMRVFLKYLKEEGGYFGAKFECVACERFYYQSLAALIPQVYQEDELERLSCTLLSAMTRFNQNNPKNKLAVFDFPQLTSALKIQLGKMNFYEAETVLRYCIQYEFDEAHEALYWEGFRRSYNGDVVIWYLRNKPRKLLEHIEDITSPQAIHTLNFKFHTMFKLMTLLEFTGVPERIIAFSRVGIHHEDPKVAKFSATALSYLATEDEYLEVTGSFLPPADGKIDLTTMKENYVTAQEALINGLSNITPTSSIHHLLKFCFGDYMKHALGSLYRIANRIPEWKLKDFLSSLYQSAVSVRKHAVDLTTCLETKEAIYDFLQTVGERDKHTSLQKITFKSTLRYFCGNPSEKFWELLKRNIKIIDENDQEAFTVLANARKLPIEHQPQYASIVYEVLAQNPSNEIRAKRYDLLTSIPNHHIDNLSLDFLTRAIGDTLLQPDAPGQHDFHLRALFYTKGEKRLGVLGTVLGVLRRHAETNWGDLMCGKARSDVYDVIRDFCLEAIKRQLDDAPVKSLLEFWGSQIKTGELLEEYLLLQLTNAYLTCQGGEGRPREYGGKVRGIYSKWVELHGSSIIPFLAEEVVDFTKHFLVDFYDDTRQVGFVKGLLGDDLSCILALNAMFGLVRKERIRNHFEPVFERVRVSGPPTVQVHLHRLLRDLEET